MTVLCACSVFTLNKTFKHHEMVCVKQRIKLTHHWMALSLFLVSLQSESRKISLYMRPHKQNMSGAGCSHDWRTCNITRKACSRSPGLFRLSLHTHTNINALVPEIKAPYKINVCLPSIWIGKNIPHNADLWSPIERKSIVELNHGLVGQVTGGQHLNGLYQFNHSIIILKITKAH